MKKIIQLISAVLITSLVFSAQAKPASEVIKNKLHRHAAVSTQKTGPVDINTADATLLTTLKGIGVKKAKAIIAYRKKEGNFKSIEALSSVPGISQKTVARLIRNNPHRLVVNP
ncbi:competence protein ComEA [Coxiella burnetii]|nr:competence protein ComEA, helix-hairpin-helix repeat region [Coxiella burnetii RSA 331]AIT63558.1 Competence protein ComEA, helix-hairpin-helix repeat region [Coxiella burnetii str. Namibia]ARK26889.1 competence protein ComEA [Coxiella burnetii]ATN86119.1 competence protein ComEA [Coxiella burnetii str. Schperling]EAX32978.1 competence protein ComEA [Coxiella burnetii 'MSU Goat Q177']EDR35276.1 competence protein ComEA, helix-hairpin-helix repeat region [Coxiella burnetii Q321]